jgi:5'-3' exonuclease
MHTSPYEQAIRPTGDDLGARLEPMRVHLVDGTYELFRYFFAVPSHVTASGQETGAIRGVMGSMLDLLEDGATHVAVATDHVIRSFRNDLYASYKSGEGIDPVLWGQAHPLEDALEAMGLTVWRMVEFEADDAMAAGAAIADADPRVEQVLICTPDKDLGQCVKDKRVVQFDRRKREIFDADGVRNKFGVDPESIPDYLGLVGDTADGFPGLPGWGAKSTAAVLARYKHLEEIPLHAGQWDVPGLRGVQKLAATLIDNIADAMLFRTIATVRTDAVTLAGGIDDIEWRGPRSDFAEVAKSIDAPRLAERAKALAASRGL